MYTKATIRGKILQEYFKDNLSFKIMKKKGELKKKEVQSFNRRPV